MCANKQSESDSCLLSDSLEVRGKGKANRRDNKAAKNRKRKERRKIKDKKRFFNAIESRKQYIKKLSNEQLTDKQITLLSRGLKFIPTPVAKENLIRRQLLADFNQFARRMRLQYIFHGELGKRTSSFPLACSRLRDSGEKSFSKKKCEKRAGAEERTSQKIIYIRESAKLSKSYLATKALFLRNLIKLNTTVLISRQDKLNEADEGQVLLDDLNNYRPLDKPMVETTTKKAQQLIKTLLSEGHIDKTTAKWLSLTPDPPRIPVFYTLTKIHKPTPVGGPIISGCSGPTERISA